MANIHFWENDDLKALSIIEVLMDCFKDEDFWSDIVITRHSCDCGIEVFPDQTSFFFGALVYKIRKSLGGHFKPIQNDRFRVTLMNTSTFSIGMIGEPFLKVKNYNLSKKEIEELIEKLQKFQLDIELENNPQILVSNTDDDKVTQRILQGLSILGFKSFGLGKQIKFYPAEKEEG